MTYTHEEDAMFDPSWNSKMYQLYAAGLFADAVDGLREYYPDILSSGEQIKKIRDAVVVKDSGDAQADYEDTRDQVERLAREAERTLDGH